MLCVDEAVSESEPERHAVPAAVAAATERAKAEAQQIADDRRSSARFPRSMLTWLEVARLKFGSQVGVVDLSAGGALIESSMPLKPGAIHSLELAGGSKPVVAKFGVLRSKVAAVTPEKIVYRTACVFTEPLDLAELKVDLAPAATPAEAAPSTVLPFAPAGTADPATAGAATEAIDKTAAVPAGWQKVVARFLDGRTAKGFTNDFAVTRQQFTLRPTPADTAAGTPVDVPVLKAVFFVRDFDGNPEYRERKLLGPTATGKRIEVRFSDGEALVGTTPGYRPNGPGFFMTPADPRANNCRIFIVSTAIRNVRFL